jgi:hypothetical protein
VGAFNSRFLLVFKNGLFVGHARCECWMVVFIALHDLNRTNFLCLKKAEGFSVAPITILAAKIVASVFLFS